MRAAYDALDDKMKAKVETEGLGRDIMFRINDEAVTRYQFGAKLSRMLSCPVQPVATSVTVNA